MNRTAKPPARATAADISRWAANNLKQLGFLALHAAQERPGFEAERQLASVGIALCQARRTILDTAAAAQRGAA